MLVLVLLALSAAAAPAADLPTDVDPGAVGVVVLLAAEGAPAPPITGDVVGVDALLARVDAARAAPVANARASELVQRGEELLLSFDHARAAALLGEAAALLEPALSAVDFDTWTRARTLSGVAWMESGNADAAKDAFTRLLAVHPDVVPDVALLSPAARAVFDAARTDVSARGTGTLEVRVVEARGLEARALEPRPSEARADGALRASIVVDGRARGSAPLSIAGLVAGTHRVAVSAPGYESVVTEVRIDANAVVPHEVALAPSRHHHVLQSLTPDAAPASVLPELRAIVAAAQLDALLFVHVAAAGDVVRVRRVTAAHDAAPVGAHVPLAPLGTLDARVRAALVPGASTSDVDFDVALLGRRRAPIATASIEPDAPSTDWLLLGAVGGGSLLVAAAATAAVVALWPQPAPERTLSVAIEMPAP